MQRRCAGLLGGLWPTRSSQNDPPGRGNPGGSRFPQRGISSLIERMMRVHCVPAAAPTPSCFGFHDEFAPCIRAAAVISIRCRIQPVNGKHDSHFLDNRSVTNDSEKAPQRLFQTGKKGSNFQKSKLCREAVHVEFKVAGLAYRYSDASLDGLRSLSSRPCKCCHVLCAVKRGNSRRTP